METRITLPKCNLLEFSRQRNIKNESTKDFHITSILNIPADTSSQILLSISQRTQRRN